MFSKLNGFKIGDCVILKHESGVNCLAVIQSFLGFREDTDNGVRLEYGGITRYHRMSQIQRIEIYKDGKFTPFNL